MSIKRSFLGLLALGIGFAPAGGAHAQAAPQIRFTADDPLRMPNEIHLGEVAGVARNSSGQIFVYTRTGQAMVTIGTARSFLRGGSRLFVYDRNGNYQREFGQDTYGFNVAQQLRVDPQDNIWIVDQMSNEVIRFDPRGRITMVLGRKAEALNVPGPAPAGGGGGGAAPGGGAGRGGGAGAAPAGGAPAGGAAPAGGQAGAPAGGRGGGAGGQAGGAPAGGGAPAAGGGGGGGGGGGAAAGGPAGESFNRPTDVTWDAAGNIYVTDGIGNTRVAKYDREGRWVKNWGGRGSGPGQFNIVSGIAVDAQNNLYVADQGNGRVQVFNTDGTFLREITGLGSPAAICISPGATQYLFVSNSNPVTNIDTAGDIRMLQLDGRVVGQFGRAGKPIGEFGTVNSIDCRSPNELLVGELGNWRVQRVRLQR